MITKQHAIAVAPDGQSIDAYTLAAGRTRVRILTFGGVVTHLFVPDREGLIGDVVLGFDDDARYVTKPSPYFGALIGRVGNRIARGRFTLDGVEHKLATNNGPNHLHGGNVGYDKRVWTAEPIDADDSPVLRLTLRDPDAAEGYPGTVDVAVTYALRDGALRIDYEATSDRATPINLTNHTYFNLRDVGATPVVDHVLQAEADAYLPVDATLIPTGDPVPVAGTPIDFTRPKPIGRDLVAMGGAPEGYDHTLVIRGWTFADDRKLRRAATVAEPTTGRAMECWTTEPGVQFYSGNFLDGSLIGKGGVAYGRRHGFCLETQHFPDSPNRPAYPDATLRPGRTYRSSTEYRFTTR